jgi:hypothetical protein
MYIRHVLYIARYQTMYEALTSCSEKYKVINFIKNSFKWQSALSEKYVDKVTYVWFLWTISNL